MFATLALIVCAGFLITHISTAALAGWRLTRPPRPRPASAPRHSVGVIVSLSGLPERNAQTALTALRLLPHVETILFCAFSADEPIVAPVQAALADIDPARARVLIGRARHTVNPKLDNMEKGLAALTTDDILALDGNIDVPADLLDRLAARRDAKTGVVSANAVGSAPGSFGAEVECQFLNTLYARWLLTSDTFGGGYAIGKVFMLSRALLNSGGPDALATDVAEDAAATKLAWRFGLAVRQTDRPVDQPLGVRTLDQVWSRMARWARLRQRSYPALYAIEWAMTPWVAAAAGGAVAGLNGISFAWGIGAVLALWYATEAALARVAGWPWGPRAILAALVRDAMALAIWPLPFFSARYEWAGQAVSLNGANDPRTG